jgi:hypothetical protein
MNSRRLGAPDTNALQISLHGCEELGHGFLFFTDMGTRAMLAEGALISPRVRGGGDPRLLSPKNAFGGSPSVFLRECGERWQKANR